MGERDMEIAMNSFGGLVRGRSITNTVETLREFGISDDTKESVREQTESCPS